MKRATGNYGIIVKTNSYAGNFERELCAFCTGVVGDEDDTGSDFIEPSEITVNFDNVELIPDEHGCYRPVELDEENPNNLIIWFSTEPTDEQIKFIKTRSEFFSACRKSHPVWGKFYQNDDIKILAVEKI